MRTVQGTMIWDIWYKFRSASGISRWGIRRTPITNGEPYLQPVGAEMADQVRIVLVLTVFIVSQRASSVMQADKIIVLDDGHAVGIGTHGELLGSCREYAEIYASQFEKGDDV